MSTYISHKLSILSFVLIMMVLYIHSTYLELYDYPIANTIQCFMGAGVCAVANPLFFAISGLLFFRNCSTTRECLPKIEKRIKTLLIPYVCWNLIFVLWYLVLYVTPGVSGFVNSNIIDDMKRQSLWENLYFLFLSPAAFQLWFLRDLILIVICTPLLFILLTRVKHITLIILAMLAAIDPYYSGPFFFALGGSIALHSGIEKTSKRITPFIALICAILYGCWCIYACITSEELNPIIKLVGMSSGLIFVWWFYDILCRGKDSHDNQFWQWVCGYSFFIYCFHEPFFNIIKKIPVHILGSNPITLVVLYFINPIILAFSSILIAKILQRFWPKIYCVLTGGR